MKLSHVIIFGCLVGHALMAVEVIINNHAGRDVEMTNSASSYYFASGQSMANLPSGAYQVWSRDHTGGYTSLTISSNTSARAEVTIGHADGALTVDVQSGYSSGFCFTAGMFVGSLIAGSMYTLRLMRRMFKDAVD